MKTLRKLIATLFSVALCAALFATPAYAQSGAYVFDEQNVLTEQQFQSLEAKGADYAQKYGIGVYAVFTNTMNGNSSPSSSQRNDFGRQFFNEHDLGVGANKNGIIMVVAVGSRDYVTVKHFNNSSEDPFSNDCVDALESSYTSYLKNNNWYAAADSYYNTTGEQMAYFKENGKQWSEPDPIGLLIKILITLGVPGFIAFGVVNGEKAAMKTARQASEASDYLDRESFELTTSNDQFVNTTLSVVPLPKEEKSGGGWSNMGGGFSGSGGGKF